AGAGWVLILLAGLFILWTYDARRGDRRSHRLLKGLFVVAVLALATLLAALVTGLAWFHVSPGAGVGNRYETPMTLADLKPSYHLGVGELRLDLSQLPPVTEETHVKARVDVGHLLIRVPAGTEVVVDAHAKVGDVVVFQQEDSGRNADVQTGRGRL